MSTSTLSIAVSALRAQSYVIETTSHNVANAATPGYRRQRVDLQPAAPRQGDLGATGAGVQATSISRASDALTDLRARGAFAQAAQLGARAELATTAEDVFGEPDHGIGTALSGMWSALAALAVAPSDEAARQQVLSSLGDVATRINDVRNGLDSIATDALTRLSAEVDSTNTAAARIAEINRYATLPGGLPPDLGDERDRLLDQLATSIGATSTVQLDGQVRVTVGGLALVDGDRATAISLQTTPTVEILHPSGTVSPGGTAGGMVTALTGDIAGMRAELDSFVTTLIDELNTLHATGLTPGGTAGGALFTDSGGLVGVVPTATGDLAAGGTAGGSQDGQIADALAQLRVPLGDRFRSVANSVANGVAAITQAADTAQTVADANDAARDSVVGVNLDEEMTQLVSAQRAYDAAAKIVSIVDEMLQSLLAM